MSESTSIPALWSTDEITIADDGFLYVSQEAKCTVEDDDLPIMLTSTSVLLQALYPSLDIKQILTMDSCYKVEEKSQEEQQSTLMDDLVSLDETNGHAPNEGDLFNTKMDYESHPESDDEMTTGCIHPKVPIEYHVYQDLVSCDNLGNCIISALLDIQYCRHRDAGSKRFSHRSKQESKVKALENQQKRLLQKRSLGNGENSRTTSEGEASTNSQEKVNVEDSHTEKNWNGDAANADDGDDGNNDNNVDTEEPRMMRLVRTLNSIRALYPHLLPILNHKRRNDKKLAIREVVYTSRKKGTMCWLLGTSVFDVTTCKLCTASHDDARRILEGYIDHELAKRVSSDPKGSLNFWLNSWVQEVLKRSSPSVPYPLTIIAALSGRSKDEILGRAHQCDRKIDDLQLIGNPKITQQYMKCVNKLYDRLSNILNARFKGARLSIYGSCLSNLSLGKGSDVDLSLYIPEAQKLKDDFQHGNISARAYEQAMKKHVYQACRKLSSYQSEFRCLNPVTRARIPVISGTYTFADNPFTNDGSLDFDICFLNDIAVANSGLFQQYSLVDRRVRSLMMSVKLWAKDCGISSAKDNHLSSYGWMNLVVFYLQCIGFLPNLQCPRLMEVAGLTPDPSKNYWHFVNDLDTCTLHWDAIKKAQIWALPQGLTEEPVSVLLYGFFEFYAKRFPISTFAISVKRASISLPKLAARKVKQFYSIEDPFETYDSHCPHDLGVPVSECGAKKIIDCFMEAEKHLRQVLGGRISYDTGLWSSSNPQNIFLGLEGTSGTPKTKNTGRLENPTKPQGAVAGHEEPTPLPRCMLPLDSGAGGKSSASQKLHANQTGPDNMHSIQDASRTTSTIGHNRSRNRRGIGNGNQSSGSNVTNSSSEQINHDGSTNHIDRREAAISNGADSHSTNMNKGRGGRGGRGRGGRGRGGRGRGGRGRSQRDHSSQISGPPSSHLSGPPR